MKKPKTTHSPSIVPALEASSEALSPPCRANQPEAPEDSPRRDPSPACGATRPKPHICNTATARPTTASQKTQPTRRSGKIRLPARPMGPTKRFDNPCNQINHSAPSSGATRRVTLRPSPYATTNQSDADISRAR